MNDLWAARDRMTFGQMVALFKEDYVLQDDFERRLDTFLGVKTRRELSKGSFIGRTVKE